MNVRPMSLKKFINITGYLLSFIDERTIVNKDNYAEIMMKTAKDLQYGGKVDRSWLAVGTYNSDFATKFLLFFFINIVQCYVSLQIKCTFMFLP